MVWHCEWWVWNTPDGSRPGEDTDYALGDCYYRAFRTEREAQRHAKRLESSGRCPDTGKPIASGPAVTLEDETE